MKVLFVSHWSGLLGANRSLLLLLKNINRDLFEPIVVTPTPGLLKREIERLNIRTYEIRSPNWVRRKANIITFGYCLVREIIALFKLYKLVHLEQIDAIYTNTIVNFSGAIISFIARKPHIWHIREIMSGNPDLHFFFSHRALFRSISKLSNMIIANSKATAEQFQGSEADKKIKVVYNAVDFRDFKKSTSFLDIDGVLPKDWLVAVVGNLQRRKGQDDAVRAVAIAKGSIPNIKLLLIGDGVSDFIDYLKQTVSELGLFDRVIFTGYRNDVLQILAHCKVCLMPSWAEPFGRITIEAMAAGIPVIGTNAGGTKEIVQDGVTGYLVPPQNPLKIAERMIRLWHRPNLAKTLGDKGKRVVKEKYNVGTYVQSIEKSILEVVRRF